MTVTDIARDRADEIAALVEADRVEHGSIDSLFGTKIDVPTLDASFFVGDRAIGKALISPEGEVESLSRGIERRI